LACQAQAPTSAISSVKTESQIMKRKIVSQTSSHSFKDTRARLRAGIEKRPLTLFAEIDHAAGASKAGLELEPSTLFIFGNPKGGTPLMARNAQMGLELPLKILVSSSGGVVTLTYMDMSSLSESYGLDANMLPVPKIVGLLDGLVKEVSAP